MQEVYLDKFIRLLDAPGIVPGPNSEVGTILRNCIHVQKLADPVTPVETILQRCNLEEVCRAVAHALLYPKGPSFFLLIAFLPPPDFQLLWCVSVPDHRALSDCSGPPLGEEEEGRHVRSGAGSQSCSG